MVKITNRLVVGTKNRKVWGDQEPDDSLRLMDKTTYHQIKRVLFNKKPYKFPSLNIQVLVAPTRYTEIADLVFTGIQTRKRLEFHSLKKAFDKK